MTNHPNRSKHALRAAFDATSAKKDGPIKKFELLKQFGPILRRDGVADIQAMSCEQLVREIDKRI